jgi:hypothetical protein
MADDNDETGYDDVTFRFVGHDFCDFFGFFGCIHDDDDFCDFVDCHDDDDFCDFVDCRDDFNRFDFNDGFGDFEQDAESGDIDQSSTYPARATTPTRPWVSRGWPTPATPRTR